MKQLLILLFALLACHLSSAQDPVAFYQFSNNANDSSANAFDGQSNGVGYCEDQNQTEREAACFNGNEHIFIGEPLNMGADDFTISMWVYVTEFTGTVGGNTGGKIINKGLTSSGSPARAGYGMRAFQEDNINKIRFEVAGSQGFIYTLDFGQAAIHTWYQVMGIKRGQSLELYVDCYLVDQVNLAAPLVVDTNMPLVFGCMHRGDDNNLSTFFRGRIDHCKIYDQALDLEERKKDCEALITSTSQLRPQTSLKIYPNPAQEFLYLESAKFDYAELRIMDTNGRIALRQAGPRTQVAIAHLPAGWYAIQLLGQQGQMLASRKFLIQR